MSNCDTCRKGSSDLPKGTIQCTKCTKNYCHTCGLTQASYLAVLKTTGWNCPPCKRETDVKAKAFDDFVNKIQEMDKKLDIVMNDNLKTQAENVEIKSRLDNIESKLQDTVEPVAQIARNEAEIAMKITEELRNQRLIERNLIFKKITANGATDEDIRTNCQQTVTEILAIVDTNVKAAKIFAILPKDRSRGIMAKVIFNSLADREVVLKSFRNNILQATNYNGIYITLDYTFEQRKARKSLYDELQSRKLNGENVRIFRNKIVPNQVSQQSTNMASDTTNKSSESSATIG